MKQSPEIAKLAAALVKAQTNLLPLAKTAANRFGKKYASLDTILEAVRPVLAEVGLVVVQGATLPTTDELGRLTSLNLETMLIHESGEWLANTVFFPVGKTVFKDADRPPEPTGADAAAATSYGRRVGLTALLALSTDEEDTAPQASSSTTRTQRAKPAEKPAAAPAPVAPAPAPVEAKKKAADRRIATPNGDKRLGDIPTPELVKLQERARGAGRSDLSDAIDEVLVARNDELVKDDLPF